MKYEIMLLDMRDRKADFLNCSESFLFPVFYGGGNCSMVFAAKGQSCLYRLSQ